MENIVISLREGICRCLCYRTLCSQRMHIWLRRTIRRIQYGALTCVEPCQTPKAAQSKYENSDNN